MTNESPYQTLYARLINANHFYRKRIDQHLRISMPVIELLRVEGIDQLHSRKLRSFAEVVLQ